MTYPTPDIDAISLRVASAMQTRLKRDPSLPRSMLGVLAKALTSGVDGLYGDIDAAARDIIYDTASEKALIRWARIWDLTLKPPVAASGQVSFSGGTGTVSAGALLSRADGVQYQLDADVTLSGSPGAGTGTVTCIFAGTMTNMGAGGVLQLVSPAPGVASNALVGAGGLSGGTDIEKAPELLVRLLERIRETPQGGSLADYEQWATSVPGVTRAWAVPGWNGNGTVGVLFMCDDRTNPIPQSADVAAVQAVLNTNAPAPGGNFAVAPTAVPLNFTIHLMPGSTVIEEAVQANLASLIGNECTPGSTLPLTQIIAAISEAAGVVDFTLSAPNANVSVAAGSITTMGAITWV